MSENTLAASVGGKRIYATTGRGGFLRREAPDLTSRLIDPFSKSACLGGAPSPALPYNIMHTLALLCRCFIHTYNLLQSSFMEESERGACLPLENTPKKLSRGKKNTSI